MSDKQKKEESPVQNPESPSQEVAVQNSQSLSPEDISNLVVIRDGLRNNYLTSLSKRQIAKVEIKTDLESYLIDNIRLYRVEEFVYKKGESITDKFTTVFNTLAPYNASIFVVIDSDGQKTNLYLGVRNNEIDESLKPSTVFLGDTLKRALKGNFPGIKIGEGEERSRIKELCDKITERHNVASVSVVGDSKTSKEQTDKQFVQGLEKLILAMNGQQYTGIILAENQPPSVIKENRENYEDLYTKLSSWKNRQISVNQSESSSRNKKCSEMNGSQKTAEITKVAAPLVGGVLGAIAGFTVAGPAGVVWGAMIGGQITGPFSGFLNSLAPVENLSNTEGVTLTSSVENKQVSDLLHLIDQKLQRLNEFDSYGVWNVGSYFISDDMSTAEIAATNYRSLMNGDNSGMEVSAINSWRRDHNEEGFKHLVTYLSRFVHPQFLYEDKALIDASTSISGKGLGLHLGLPRTSFPGMVVAEHAEFGKEVNKYTKEDRSPNAWIKLGKIFDLGQITENDVRLDNKSLNMHTFITGSTGSGKSNAVYQMLTELHQDGVNFLVIEPAKGEYKEVFGNWEDVNVYSTNPNIADLIHINPFKFPSSIHVLEHIDGLVEIFSACWPMYDAMPAFLKEAIVKSYEEKHWDIGSSTYESDEEGAEKEYPDFDILVKQLEQLIENSDYSAEVKGNYTGALVTRVRSLTVGLNKYIFMKDQTPYEEIFDENCILDISRVKSIETKSLIMGLVVYILNEYREDKKSGSNSDLKHVTVLEEAHNLLKNTTASESELVRKSVEVLANTIAEIRTYGEGFIIVDQSPSSVDIAAIKNTNTKIVLRTPEANDRESVGRSMGLTPVQVNEIAKLPSGVAVVYQNDWVDPVLAKINKAKVKSMKASRTDVIRAIMEPWLPGEKVDFSELKRSLDSLELKRDCRKLLETVIRTYEDDNGHMVWDQGSLGLLRALLLDIMNISEGRFEKVLDPENLGALRDEVRSKTEGFTPEQIEEICHVLTMEG